jgi:nitrile hydratase accessory protein
MSELDAMVDPVVVAMDGLPRQNGELVFEQPWEARAFGVAIALCREQGIEWEAFRSRLIDEIAAWEREHGSGPSDEWRYYERWAATLERLVLELGLVAEPEVAARAEQLAHADRHDHDHDHDHDSDRDSAQVEHRD